MICPFCEQYNLKRRQRCIFCSNRLDAAEDETKKGVVAYQSVALRAGGTRSETSAAATALGVRSTPPSSPAGPPPTIQDQVLFFVRRYGLFALVVLVVAILEWLSEC